MQGRIQEEGRNQEDDGEERQLPQGLPALTKMPRAEPRNQLPREIFPPTRGASNAPLFYLCKYGPTNLRIFNHQEYLYIRTDL